MAGIHKRLVKENSKNFATMDILKVFAYTESTNTRAWRKNSKIGGGGKGYSHRIRVGTRKSNTCTQRFGKRIAKSGFLTVFAQEVVKPLRTQHQRYPH